MACLLVLALTATCSQKKKTVARDDSAEDQIAGVEAVVSIPLVTWVVPAVKIEIRSARGPAHELDATGYAELLGSGLRASPYFAIDAAGVDPPRLAVSARVLAQLSYDEIEEGSTGSPAVVVTLEVAVLPSDESYLPVTDNVIVERVLAKGETASTVRGVIDRRARGAIGASVSALVEKERLRGAPAGELAEATKKTTDVAMWALDLIADRRDRSLVDVVIAQFRARDERVVSAAITAAVALGDAKAVAPMVKQADLQDYEQLRVLIEASSVLGGKDAAEFLEFIASGHADDAIKQQASEALTRLRP